MTSEGHDELNEAVEVVKAFLILARNPAVMASLQKLQEQAKNVAVQEAMADRHPEKEPDKGTCPTCGKKYTILKNGALRRHGTGKCYMQKQLPAEIIPAVLAIAQLGPQVPEEFQDGNNA